MRLSSVTLIASIGLAAAGGYGLHAYADGAPSVKPVFYAGTLESNGRLASGLHSIVLSLFDQELEGTQLCTSESTDTVVENGRFRVEVSAKCVATMRSQPDVWAALRFTGPDGVPHELPKRSKVGAVPYAMEAQHAVSASNAAKALTATSADTSKLATQADSPTPGGPLQTRLAALEGAKRLTEVKGDALYPNEPNAGVAEHATPCLQDPGHLVHCAVAANRKCYYVLGYAAGWYVGECAGEGCRGRAIICVK